MGDRRPKNSTIEGGNAFPGFQARGHDHEHCIETALGYAHRVCAHNSARLTPLRRRVLEIVWQSHNPLGAYAILETLSEEGHSPAPPTVYRSLEFLLEQGLVHRIASLNAFIGCVSPGHPGAGQFLICSGCGTAAELDDPEVERAIAGSADRLGFEAAHHTIEVTGLCPSCQDAAGHAR